MFIQREIFQRKAACSNQMRMKRFAIISCTLLPLTASAQQFTFGLQGGIPAQTPLGQTNDKMPFVLGPTVDMRLSSGFSISTGVLFSRTGRRVDNYSFLFPENALALGYSTSQSRAIEVPLLAKYRFLGERRSWRPFVTGGAAIRRTSIETSTSMSVIGSPASSFALQPVVERKAVRWNVDPVAGVGVDFRAGRFHLEPEIRYSYWGAGKHTMIRKNQAQFLLGFRF